MDEITEEYISSVEKEAVENTTTSERLCDMCHNESWKYRCPRCSFRTCSLPCSKEHKVKYDCSGERQKSFDVIKRLVDYSSSVAVDDEKFLNSVTTSLNSAANHLAHINTPDSTQQSKENESKLEVLADIATEEITETHHDEHCANESDDNGGRSVLGGTNDEKEMSPSQLDGGTELTVEHLERKAMAMKRYLLNNAHRRRIWLTVTPDKEGNSSRHEQFSDTIFWTIRIIFRREEQIQDVKQIIENEYTVNNIPESISVTTLVRQFIKPKLVGPVVSKSDLDTEKMAPFQEAGMDKLMIYMPVPIEGKKRFYVIDMSKTILDNTRNRFILEYPTFIVTLDNQFNDYVMLSEQEARELRELQRQKNREENQNNFRGRGRFDNGRFMSRGRDINRGGRGGGRRGGFKRSYNSPDSRGGRGSGRPWKCGRPFRGGYHQNRDFHERNNDGRGTLGTPSDYRSSIAPQADPIMDAWSKALESKTKKEIPSNINNSSEVQAIS
ncbi:HIT zinc finger family protein [Brugia malayi]|uniref:Box C/D snoRNA protein 1 n=1 Tax=Brugia malayi TaxID=6279 RepID=A0A0H5SI63_BRUMA|nr:HIT zinc finger family protein [Brugia malayi]CRZ23530.1 BMA-ZHIT-3 [Brugia malayi]VIO97832.1 HIT zinc finger family protein [Brugia malayi]